MSQREDENPYSGNKFKRSLLHFFSGKSIVAVIGVLNLLLLVRALPKDQYGIAVSLIAFFEIIQLITNFGSFAAAYRYIPELRATQRNGALFRFSTLLMAFRFITLLLSVALIYLFAAPIAEYMAVTEWVLILQCYLLVILFEGMSRFVDVFFDSLLLQGKSQVGVIFRNGLRLLGVAVFGFLLSMGQGFNLDVWIKIELVASISGFILVGSMLFRSLYIYKQSGISDDQIDYARIRAYCIPAFVSQLLGGVQGPDIVKVIIMKLTDAIQVGAFGFAASINGMLQRYLPAYLLIGLVRPLFVSAKSGKSYRELVAMATLLFKINIFILAPIFAVVVAENSRVASLLSGGKFPEAGIYLVFLIMLLGFQLLHTVMGLLALAVEESIAGFWGSALGVAGLFIGIGGYFIWGQIALCAGMIVSEVIWCVVMQRALHRHRVGFYIRGMDVYKMLIVTALATAIGMVLEQVISSNTASDIWSLSLISSSVVITYLVFLTWLKFFDESERGFINKALPKPVFVW